MKCEIEGVVIRELTAYSDERGWLVELFRHDELEKEYFPEMGYVSLTRPGLMRGPHEHRQQTDFFVFMSSSIFRLYLWDNRKDSITYRKTFQFDTGEKCYLAVIIPPGVVHAYKNIGSADGLVFNAPNRLYKGEKRKNQVDEIRYEDNPDSPFKIPE